MRMRRSVHRLTAYVKLSMDHSLHWFLVPQEAQALKPQTFTNDWQLSLLAEKYRENCSKMMQLIRCRLNFALLRSSILCIRDTRCSIYKPVKLDLLGLVESEAHLNEWLVCCHCLLVLLHLGVFFMF